VTQIDVLPNDVLLEIFDFYMNMNPSHRGKLGIEAWQSLVHVCRRWRGLVFESPRRLNLRLFCTPETPARTTLDVWPALPLIVSGNMALSSGTDNVIAALGQRNRVRQVNLHLAGRQLEEVSASMQMPFPELTEMRLWLDVETVSVIPIPDSFLGGSIPLLQHFELSGIPFPGLLKPLSSATHLVYLKLFNIPHSGYFSPKGSVALISALPSLEALFLEFQSPQSCPDRETRPPPLSKRSILPALRELHFKGVTEYLEDFVTCIDAPQLQNFYITFLNQIDFDTPRLAQFINRAHTTFSHARVHFNDTTAAVKLTSWTQYLEVEVSCREPDWQLSSVAQVCNSCFPPFPFSMVEDLYIEHEYSQLIWNSDAIENALWLELLLPFTAVKNFYPSKGFAPDIAVALKELVGVRITEVLPSLQNIFVEELNPPGPFQENIRQFVAARRLSGHPITISLRVQDRISPSLMTPRRVHSDFGESPAIVRTAEGMAAILEIEQALDAVLSAPGQSSQAKALNAVLRVYIGESESDTDCESDSDSDGIALDALGNKRKLFVFIPGYELYCSMLTIS
jgi:hypothetical protein